MPFAKNSLNALMHNYSVGHCQCQNLGVFFVQLPASRDVPGRPENLRGQKVCLNALEISSID